jgi:hypothetical protein
LIWTVHTRRRLQCGLRTRKHIRRCWPSNGTSLNDSHLCALLLREQSGKIVGGDSDRRAPCTRYVLAPVPQRQLAVNNEGIYYALVLAIRGRHREVSSTARYLTARIAIASDAHRTRISTEEN